MRVLHYLGRNGEDIYQEWLDRLLDLNGRIAIQRRIDRIENTDNLGIRAFCQNGVWELKIDAGPGYRVYYSKIKGGAIILLCGGVKKAQRKDIGRAVRNLEDYIERT